MHCKSVPGLTEFTGVRPDSELEKLVLMTIQFDWRKALIGSNIEGSPTCCGVTWSSVIDESLKLLNMFLESRNRIQ